MAVVTLAARLPGARRLVGVPGWHEALRPAWDCNRCGLPYPCEVARRQLLARHGLSVALGELAWQMLEQAVRDRPDLPLAELFDRFVSWTLPPEPPPPAPLLRRPPVTGR
jgi:hypothetical protein